MAQGEQEERRPLVESASECSSSLESSLVMSAPGRHKRLLERASPFGSSSPLASTASSFLLGSSSSSIASSSMENLIPDNTNDNLIIPMTLTGEEQQQDSLSTRTSSSSRSTLRPHSSNSYGTLDKEITTMHHAHAHEQEDTFQSSRLPLLNNSQLSSRRHSTLLSPTLWPVSQRASRLLHDQLYDSSGGGADGTYYDNFTTVLLLYYTKTTL